MSLHSAPGKRKKLFLKIAHITDVHVKPQENSVERFKKCLEEVKGHKIDFVLNGGDSVNAVDYDYITREKTLELWGLWDDCIRILDGYEIYSCLGNHDTWWAAPDKSDPMYGKPYAVKRLKIPHRYYSFSKSGWHFIVLDGNNEKEFSLDQEQFDWLVKDLENRPQDTPTLIMSHYTILGVTPHLVGGMHADFKKLKELFYQHRDKVKICLSGHNHLFDHCEYNGVQYCCNGAMSGYWWEKGDKESAGPYYYQETPPGYAILTLFDDGTVENRYVPHKF